MSAFADIGYRPPASAPHIATDTGGGCPWPGCANDVPPRCVFCADHYFKIPAAYNRAIYRLQIRAERCSDPTVSKALASKAKGYIRSAIQQALNGGNCAE